jgi:hypothetical protein
MMLEKTMTFINVGNSTHNIICGSNQGNCNATVKKFLEFVLQKHENGLPVASETTLMQAFEVTVLPYIILHSDISKPLMVCLSDVCIMNSYFFIAGLH